jgi:hypothetical protein
VLQLPCLTASGIVWFATDAVAGKEVGASMKKFPTLFVVADWLPTRTVEPTG